MKVSAFCEEKALRSQGYLDMLNKRPNVGKLKIGTSFGIGLIPKFWLRPVFTQILKYA